MPCAALWCPALALLPMQEYCDRRPDSILCPYQPLLQRIVNAGGGDITTGG